MSKHQTDAANEFRSNLRAGCAVGESAAQVNEWINEWIRDNQDAGIPIDAPMALAQWWNCEADWAALVA